MRLRAVGLLVIICCLVLAGEARPVVPDESNEQEIQRLCRQGSYFEALELATMALHSAERGFGPSDTAVARAATTLARIYRWQGRLEEAELHYERALAILEESHGPDHPDVAVVLNELGLIRQDQGLDAAAEWFFTQALGIAERSDDFYVPGLAEILNHMASVCFAQARYQEAEQWCERALELLEDEADARQFEDADVRQFELAALRRNLASIREMMGRDSLGIPEGGGIGSKPDRE